jgi:transposase
LTPKAPYKPALAKAGVAVIKACLYEPEVNRTYPAMAAHYDIAILPAQPRRPRDKAKSLP